MPPRLALDLKLAFITAQPTPGQPPPADPAAPPGVPPGAVPAGPMPPQAGPAPAPAPMPAAGPLPADPSQAQPPAPPPPGPVDPVTGQPEVASMPVPAPANPPRPRTSADALQEAQLLGLAEAAQHPGSLASPADPAFALRLAAVREQGRLVKQALSATRHDAVDQPTQADQQGQVDHSGQVTDPGGSGGRFGSLFAHSAKCTRKTAAAASEISTVKAAAGPLGSLLQAGRQAAPAIGKAVRPVWSAVKHPATAPAVTATAAGIGLHNASRVVGAARETRGEIADFRDRVIPETMASAKQQFRSTADDYLKNHAIPQVQQQVGQFAQQLPGQLINGAGTNLLALLTYLFGPGQAQAPKPNPQAAQHAAIIRGQSPVAPAV